MSKTQVVGDSTSSSNLPNCRDSRGGLKVSFARKSQNGGASG